MEELFRMVKSRPESEAIAILQRIRNKSDLNATLSSLREGDVLIQQQVVTPELEQSAFPAFESLTEPELTNMYPVAYPHLESMELALAASLAASEDPGKGKISLDTNRSFTSTSGTSLKRRLTLPAIPRLTASDEPIGRAGILSDNSGFHVNGSTIDPRLHRVNASLWTSVKVDDELFAKIVASFISWNHLPIRFFDEDIFLDDLVAGGTDFCSKLLVNAVLAIGCYNYSSSNPLAQNMAHFFAVEAKQLWGYEQGKESLPTIAATGLRMAEDFGLFRKKAAPPLYDTKDSRRYRGQAVIAWGIYTHAIVLSLWMRRDMTAKSPPPVPILETDNLKPWFAYPLPFIARPGYFGKTVKASCELWVIAKDILPVYYGGEAKSISFAAVVHEVKRIYHRLLAWSNSMPNELQRSVNAPPHVLMMHIHFHSILVELFRPFVVDSPLSALRATIYHYATTYGGPPVSAYLMSSLLSVVYSTMPDLDNPQSRFFFSFTIKFLGALSDQFPIIRYIMQGIYQSANQAGNTFPQEAIDILQEQSSTSFVPYEDRLTSDLEHSILPKILSSTAAIDEILTATLDGAQFLIWMGPIHDSIDHQASQHACQVAKLGTFALRHWWCKRLKGSWIAVSSRQEDHFDNQRTARSNDRPADPEELNPSESLRSQDEDECPALAPLARKELNKVDHVTTAEAKTMNILQEAQSTTGLPEDWTVDWLGFPHLTSDPWIQYLVRHDWSSTAVDPMHNWDPTLRQIYSTILSSE
ncbi:hypothetical protein KCV03_g9970, partial [Aureobasidium melanogenum]